MVKSGNPEAALGGADKILDLYEDKRKYGKCSDKEKRTAVDYYFSYERDALKIVKVLGYPSRAVLIEWVKELSPEEKIWAVMESCWGNLKISQIVEIYNVSHFCCLYMA